MKSTIKILLNVLVHSILAIIILNLYIFVATTLHVFHIDISIGIFTRIYFLGAFLLSVAYYIFNESSFGYRKKPTQLLIIFLLLSFGLVHVFFDYPYRSSILVFAWFSPYFLIPFRRWAPIPA